MGNLNNIAIQYDIYFSGGKHSLYNKRFGHAKVISRESSAVKSAYKEALKNCDFKKDNITNKLIFRVLDFGCGDGRLFSIIEEIAAANQDIIFIVHSYDLSSVALKCFEDTLKNKRYKEQETNPAVADRKLKNHGHVIQSAFKGNIHIKLIQGYDTDTIDHTMALIGDDIHLNLCMFGTISHVYGRKNRQNILKMFNQLASQKGKIVISVPGPRMFSKELLAFNLLKQHFSLAKKYDLTEYCHLIEPLASMVKEEGDIYYFRYNNDTALVNYSHVFTIAELAMDLQVADLFFPNIQILSITYVPDLTKKPWILRFLDSLASRALSLSIVPSKWSEKFVDQYIAIASPNLK